MTNEDLRGFGLEVMTVLKEAFPERQVAESTILLYFSRLRGYDLRDVTAAALAAVDTLERFPTVAKMREMASAASRARRDEEEQRARRYALPEATRPEEVQEILGDLARRMGWGERRRAHGTSEVTDEEGPPTDQPARQQASPQGHAHEEGSRRTRHSIRDVLVDAGARRGPGKGERAARLAAGRRAERDTGGDAAASVRPRAAAAAAPGPDA